ncbi:MAG TPA: shikimate dehydrogenase [Streptosporangiaceae bacterium]|nr:shikimate dehydrogenase [Streptosporangiaceae bacterium]
MQAAVAGSPIAHSLSPALHRAAYAALGLSGWSYRAIECDEAGLPALLDASGPGWAGLSLTMPLKRAVLPLLDHIHPVAAATGSANTVVFSGGARHGYNTDVAGLVTAITEAGFGSPPGEAGFGSPPGEVLILGAGATACSALAAARDLGLDAATVAVRDPGRAEGLRAAATRLGIRVHLAPYGKLSGHRPGLVISTLPAGAADLYTGWLRDGEHAPAVVFDVVYHPWPTALAQAAREAGAVTIGGFEMLLHQAARQVELMTGYPAPVEAMREAVSQEGEDSGR